jgi:hypothetical protein
MKWATRIGMKTDRVACAWLIRNHIDRDAEFFFFPTDRLIDEAKKIGATTFDAAGADFPHIGMRCAFEVMMDHYGLWGKDPALDHMAMIVHASDVNIKLYDFTVLEAFGTVGARAGLRRFGARRPRKADRRRPDVRGAVSLVQDQDRHDEVVHVQARLDPDLTSCPATGCPTQRYLHRRSSARR